MKYLYGDATPFPLEENFIETLSAATDACVALFQADLEMRDRQERAVSIRERAAEELGYLDGLSHAIETAVTPMLPSGEALYAAQRTASTISRSARAAIDQAREGVARERDAAIKSTIGSDLSGRAHKALADFLLAHQLPDTRWDISWTHDLESAQSTLSLSAAAECGVQAVFTGHLPADERWSVPLRLSDIDPHAQLSIQRNAGWLSRLFKGSTERISGFYITQVELRNEEARFRVHRQLKASATGYEVRIRGTGQGSPQVYPLGTGETEPLPVYGEDAVDLTDLWSHLESELRALARHRTRMTGAFLHGRSLTDLEEPGELAEVILMTLAPIVREMRLRSRVPGELVLKRDLGNGRREELFVPRQELEAKFESLPHEQQRYFQAAGLGGEATVDFVHRTYPREEPEQRSTDEVPTQVPRLAPAPGNAAA